jgi:hypothetical protein
MPQSIVVKTRGISSLGDKMTSTHINVTSVLFETELKLRMYLCSQYRALKYYETLLKETPSSARYRRPQRGSCASSQSRIKRSLENRKKKIHAVYSKLEAILV